ncbi:alpha/beta fold hydrolase [Nocardia sp. CA-145437]|uniref:alpha/beta fold hydrolase n=1 Tax=Nocardia sp. CA-145437 TaxID=3239980 RepID=UPI003D9645FE
MTMASSDKTAASSDDHAAAGAVIEERTVSYAGVRTRELAVAGAGLPIVLLHGYADSADTWRGVLTRLGATGRRALAVDLPGFGLAQDRRSGALTPQFDEFADAVVAAHGPVVLVGNSLGAATTLRAAARHRDGRVAGIVLLDEPLLARHRPARLVRRREYTRLFGLASALPVPAPVLRWGIRRLAAAFCYGPGVTADPMYVDTWLRSIPDMPAAAARARDAVRYAREHPNGHGDLSIGCPALVVHGAKDRIIPVAASRELHALLPGSELVVLPRAGHCPQVDYPTEVTRLVLDHAARVDPRSEWSAS